MEVTVQGQMWWEEGSTALVKLLCQVCTTTSRVIIRVSWSNCLDGSIGRAIDCKLGNLGLIPGQAVHFCCHWSWNPFYGHSHCTSALACTEVISSLWKWMQLVLVHCLTACPGTMIWSLYLNFFVFVNILYLRWSVRAVSRGRSADCPVLVISVRTKYKSWIKILLN
jgi:hypothetical protein